MAVSTSDYFHTWVYEGVLMYIDVDEAKRKSMTFRNIDAWCKVRPNGLSLIETYTKYIKEVLGGRVRVEWIEE